MSFIDKAREALSEFARVDTARGEGSSDSDANFASAKKAGKTDETNRSAMSQSDFPWGAVYPYLSHNRTVCRGILGSVVATQGSGPYTEDAFDLFLSECGIDIRPISGDYAPQVVILGRENWSTGDLDELQQIPFGAPRVYSQEMVIASMAIGRDIFEIDDDDLLVSESFFLGHPALEYFYGYERSIPSRPVGTVDEPVETLRVAFDAGSERPTVGILGDMGYHVGKVRGLPRLQRHEILWRTFRVRLTATSPWTEEYINEWGQRCSAERFSKMCNVLRRLMKTAEQTTTRDMSVAIEEWEEDLQFLLDNKPNWLQHSH
jgi:hypothetical protein